MTLYAASLLFALPIAAQQPSTWHGLHFGDTVDQVKAQLAAQDISTSTSLDGVLSAVKDYDLELPGLSHAITLLPRFHFTTDGRLQDVTLPVDLAGMRREWNGTTGNDSTTLLFAQQHLAGALAGIYGAPIYTSPGCDVAAKDPAATCVLFWKGDAQTITLERSGSSLFVRYQTVVTDL